MAAAGALVELGGGCGTIQTGWDKLFVEIGEAGDCCVSEAGDEDVLVLVLADW